MTPWARLLAFFREPEWSLGLRELAEANGYATTADMAECAADRCDASALEVIELYKLGAGARYPSGRAKRTRYAPVDLSERKVVGMVHQAGFERGETRSIDRAHLMTAHTVVTPQGKRCRIHPPSTRLVAGNRVDRAPYHGLHIEVIGNFERIDGTGTWWSPDRMGAGRASEAQIAAVNAELRHWDETVPGGLWAAMPHAVAGRDSKGRPNREGCCGSRLHAECVEWAGAEMGVLVPGPGFELGGVEVDPRWHGRHWPRCRRTLGA